LVALVDTGAACTIIKKGILPQKFLENAKNAKNFIGAGGEKVLGGKKGCVINCTFPDSTEPENSWTSFMYEAEIEAECILSVAFLFKHQASLSFYPSPSLKFPGGVSVPTVGTLTKNQMDFLKSAHPFTENYSLHENLVEKMLELGKNYGIFPKLDAFATAKNARLESFWTEKENAFSKNWNGKCLWLNPPWTKLSEVVEKIISERASGILICPKWNVDWLKKIQPYVLTEYNFGAKWHLFRTESGKLMPPPKWQTVAIFFDAGLRDLFEDKNFEAVKQQTSKFFRQNNLSAPSDEIISSVREGIFGENLLPPP
jgi:hypothetical protein